MVEDPRSVAEGNEGAWKCQVHPHPGLPVRFTAGTGRRPSLPYAVHYVFAWQNGSSTRRGLAKLAPHAAQLHRFGQAEQQLAAAGHPL